MVEKPTERSTLPLGPRMVRASSRPVASSMTIRCAGVPSGRVASTTVAGRPATVRAPSVESFQRPIGRREVVRRRFDHEAGPSQMVLQVGAPAFVDDRTAAFGRGDRDRATDVGDVHLR